MELNEVEKRKLDAFKAIHDRRCGGKYLYSETLTGIGVVLKAECIPCGAKVDYTDYDLW